MKPPPFDYADPRTLAEALELVADAGDDAAVIAGGQSLIPLMNLRLARPELVVDLRHIHELTALEKSPAGLRAAAMVRAATLEQHPAVDSVPGLRPALGHIGHSQIRARTTVGGSIAHADPAAELPALLVALDGEVELTSSARGRRLVPAADFLVGPLMTSRAADELVTAVSFPAHRGRVVIAELAKRPGDFAVAGTICAYASTEGVISDARVCLFGVAGTPVRVGRAEALLDGAAPGPDVFAAAADEVRAGLEPQGDLHGSADYRRHLAATLVERALGGMW